MSKFAKKILIVCAALAGLLALLLLIANLYLQSDGVQSRIRQAASSALGAPITMSGSYFTPWGGFLVTGLAVPNPDDPGTNLLEADSLRIRIAVLPLLQGRIVVKRVTLNGPNLIARQRESREWVALVPPPPSPEIPVEVPPPPSDRTATAPRTFKVEIESIRIRRASASFIDAGGRTVMKFEGGEGEAVLNDDFTSSGHFRIGQIEISNSLRPQDVGGDFSWDGSVLEVPELAGTLAGGALTGRYRLVTDEDPSFELDFRVAGARLRRLAEDAGTEAGRASGTLNSTVSLAGDPRDSAALTGKANLDMVEARFTPVDFIVQLGQLLGVDELQLLNLSEATSQFTIAEGQVHVDSIFLKSENLILAGEGTAGFDGSLDLDGRFLINRKLQRQLRALVNKNFVDSDDPEYKQLPFKVTNTLANPRTDLLDKLIGIRVGEDVGGMLRNLFGNPQPSKKKKNEPKD